MELSLTAEGKNFAETPRDEGGRFLQSPFWAAFKSAHGWNALSFAVSAQDERGSHDFTLSVLVRDFGRGPFRFSLAYVPMAPEIFHADESPSAQASEYARALMEIARQARRFLPKNTICVRFDPPVEFNSIEERDSFARDLAASAGGFARLLKTKVDIQPPDTSLLDLSLSAEELLARMKSKWRYNIRLAERKGVAVSAFRAGEGGVEDALEIFYSLYKTTSARDGIAIHAKKYYDDLLRMSADWRAAGDAPLVSVYVASHEGEPLASIITLFSKREAVYLYGASGNSKRNLMPAYLLQWTAINDAKNYGSRVYDFYGMPPTDDENHPMRGLYLFKTGFGGASTHRPGSFDAPLSRAYSLCVAVENVRAFLRKRVAKRLAGR